MGVGDGVVLKPTMGARGSKSETDRTCIRTEPEALFVFETDFPRA